MKTSVVTATNARTNLFEIINKVYFGGEEIVITKNDKPVVRISKEDEAERKGHLMNLAGSLSPEEADTIKSTIKELKRLPARKTPSHL